MPHPVTKNIYKSKNNPKKNLKMHLTQFKSLKTMSFASLDTIIAKYDSKKERNLNKLKKIEELEIKPLHS